MWLAATTRAVVQEIGLGTAITTVIAAWVFGGTGCGYHSIRGLGPSAERLCPSVLRSSVSDPLAVEAVVEGLREALARAGRLGDCSVGASRIVVRLLESRSESEGLIVSAGSPQSRAFRAIAVGDAQLVKLDKTQELGEARVEVVAASSQNAEMEGQLEQDARVVAARALGGVLGRRALGEAAPSELR